MSKKHQSHLPDYWKSKRLKVGTGEGLTTSKATSIHERALKASYLVANRIAKAKKSFAIGEEFILPATMDICCELLGKAEVEEIKQVALSAATVNERIKKIAEDIEMQLLERIRASPWYALQLDESTNIDNEAILLVYVRYVYEKDVHEDMLHALSMRTESTAAELFESLNDYISKELEWSFCVGICTDGAAATTRRLSGLIAEILQVTRECESTHYFIRREMLVRRSIPLEFDSVLNDVACVTDKIKSNALNSRLFEQLCEKITPKHRHLLLYERLTWLSRGKSLSAVFELREPLQRFLLQLEENSQLARRFSNKDWVAKLAYLCDIFDQLNELNGSLSGKTTTVFKLADRVAAFKDTLNLWRRDVEKGTFDMFPTFTNIMENPTPSLSQLVSNHLRKLLQELECYFPTAKDPRTAKEWIRNPFVNRLNVAESDILTRQEKEQLLKIANDGELKSTLQTKALPVFWIKVREKYPEIAAKALKTLLLFPTSRLCEEGLSAVIGTKTELRRTLDITKTLRVLLSPIPPRWDRLVRNELKSSTNF